LCRGCCRTDRQDDAQALEVDAMKDLQDNDDGGDDDEAVGD